MAKGTYVDDEDIQNESDLEEFDLLRVSAIKLLSSRLQKMRTSAMGSFRLLYIRYGDIAFNKMTSLIKPTTVYIFL